MNHPYNEGMLTQEPSSPIRLVWNPNFYRLQLEAPYPKPCNCNIILEERPPFYGSEFHGTMSHIDASFLLKEEGSYLIRQSEGTNGFYTLSLRFNGKIKHYKLYYDGQHFVKDKHFDSVFDLVADGLVTLYIEANAGPYMELMDSFNSYEKSPYMTLNKLKRKAVITQNSHKRKIAHSSTQIHQNFNENDRSVEQNNQHADQVDTPTYESNRITTEICDYEKAHYFKIHTFKGLNWCEFCGNFLWGFIAQGVKCDDCGFSAHSKCSQKVPNDCCPDLKQIRGVFGIDLTTLVKAHRTSRPFVIDKCIEEIEKRGLETEGLYRVSGFAEEIETLKLALDRDGEHADLSPNSYDNINVIAGTLKLYLRLLPIPLITYEAHPVLIKAAQKKLLAEQLDGVKNSLSLLPPAHYNCLKYLMEHLYRVVQLQNINKMSAHNLSTIFAPTLMPVPDLSKGLPGMTYEIMALEILILHQDKIFN